MQPVKATVGGVGKPLRRLPQGLTMPRHGTGSLQKKKKCGRNVEPPEMEGDDGFIDEGMMVAVKRGNPACGRSLSAEDM